MVAFFAQTAAAFNLSVYNFLRNLKYCFSAVTFALPKPSGFSARFPCSAQNYKSAKPSTYPLFIIIFSSHAITSVINLLIKARKSVIMNNVYCTPLYVVRNYTNGASCYFRRVAACPIFIFTLYHFYNLLSMRFNEKTQYVVFIMYLDTIYG